jgi:predicted RNase H-like nuclease
MDIFFGVDGCPDNRWIVVSCDSANYFQDALIKESIQEILDYTPESTLTLIDIPIGLKDKKQPGKRACDVEARKILKKRASSVFPAPQRESLQGQTWEEASIINRKICEKGLSKQTWGIMKKIAQVDSILIRNVSLQSRFKETHPEICFWGLNTHQTMNHKKDTDEGIKERLKVLNRFSENAGDFFNEVRNQHFKKNVKSDDIVDAMVAALTAALSIRGTLQTLPQTPETDSYGLRMEIVFPDLQEIG